MAHRDSAAREFRGNRGTTSADRGTVIGVRLLFGFGAALAPQHCASRARRPSGDGHDAWAQLLPIGQARNFCDDTSKKVEKNVASL